jgi:uncharacterized protein (TIGR03083 family)
MRHVAAHLGMPFRYSMVAVTGKMIAAMGNFNKVADNAARKDAALPTAELGKFLRDNADHKFKPPGNGYEAPLIDVIVHGLDIRVPLGLTRQIPEERARVVLDNLTKPKIQKFFKATLPSVTLSATDMDWTSGSGPTVSGNASDLMLLLSKRPGVIERLTGEGIANLA